MGLDDRGLQSAFSVNQLPSWPGFVPAIHVFASARFEDVDARHKAGHDD